MKQIKIEIKTIFGKILFSHESEENTVKKTVAELLKEKKGEWIEEADLSNLDLSGIDFSNSKFDNSTFDNSKFYNSKFYNSKFYNSTFDNSKFYNSKFYNSTFDNSTFYNSKFYNSTFDNSKFYNSKFYNSTFDNSTFYNSKFYNSTFDNSTFYNSKFYNSTFDNSKFYNSKFYNSTFDSPSFISLKESGALEPIRCDFFGRMLILKKEVPALRQALVDGKVNGSAYEGECSCFMGTVANARHCKYNAIPELKPDINSDTERWFMAISKGDTPETSPIVKQTVEWIDEFKKYLDV
jgi:uncharacterized protein YjbI with pentapeptide repeats